MNNEETTTTLAEPIRVSIFNQTYSLRSHSDEEHVKRIAQLVDERMRQIALQAPNHDLMKVAVLTALNIADELQRLKEHYEREQDEKGQTSASQAAEGAVDPLKGDETHERDDQTPSWYEDLFDARTGSSRSDQRLSTRISSKLQMLRQTGQEPVTIEAEEEGD